MFCYKCGTQLANDASFCHRCGTKVAEENDMPIIIPDESIPQPSLKNNIPEDSGTTEKLQQPVSIRTGENEPAAVSSVTFKSFVDNHIRTTTVFQSAEELLSHHVSLWRAWLLPAVAAVITGVFCFLRLEDILGASILALFFFVIFLYISYFVVWRKRNQYMTKFSGTFNGDIDASEIIAFLNEKLAYLSPYFHKWGFLQQSGYSIRSIMETSVETAISRRMQELRLCTEFGNKTNMMTVLYLKPDTLDQASDCKKYFVDVKQKFSFGFPQFSTYTCVYKAAPILQAAIEYYLQYRRSESEHNMPIATTVSDKESMEKPFAIQGSQLVNDTPNKAQKKNTRKLTVVIVSVTLTIIIGLFIICNWHGKTDYAATVREYEPFAVSQGLEYTCGEVFDKYIIDSEWSVRESDETYYVDISGTAKGTDNCLAITISVTANSDANDTVSMRPESVTINGVVSDRRNDAVKFILGMFLMYDEKYDNISALFSEFSSSIEIQESNNSVKDHVNNNSNKYAAAYIEKIHSFGDEYTYNLIYLNDDEIPELVVDYPGFYVSIFTWRDEALFTVMDDYPYGTGGNMGYQYLPKESIILSTNNDMAGAIINDYYMTLSNEFEIIDLYDELPNVRYYKDKNGNKQIDENEISADTPYYFYGDTEITEDEYLDYQIPGDYESIKGTFSVAEILSLLDVSETSANAIYTEILYNDYSVFELIGQSKEDIYNVFSKPTGGTPVTGELLYGGTEYYAYEGISFLFDEQGAVAYITASADSLYSNNTPLNLSHSEIVDIFGEPAYEGQIQEEDDYGESVGEYYIMEYSQNNKPISFTFEMENIDGIVYKININKTSNDPYNEDNSNSTNQSVMTLKTAEEAENIFFDWVDKNMWGCPSCKLLNDNYKSQTGRYGYLYEINAEGFQSELIIYKDTGSMIFIHKNIEYSAEDWLSLYDEYCFALEEAMIADEKSREDNSEQDYEDQYASLDTYDLIGSYSWDGSNNRSLTFYSNGTCDGTIAYSFLPSMNYVEVFHPEAWNFLEYEQIIQLYGYYTTSEIVSGYNSWGEAANHLVTNTVYDTLSFNVSMIGTEFYFECVNDTDTGLFVYDKVK